MKYINLITKVILETDSHLEGGDWSLLEETSEKPKKEEKPKQKNKK